MSTDERETMDARFHRRRPIAAGIVGSLVVSAILAVSGWILGGVQQGQKDVGELAGTFDFVDESGDINDAIGSLSTELEAREDQIRQLESDEEGKKAISLARSRWDSGDYAGALTVLSEVAGVSSEAFSAYVDYSSQYVEMVLRQVDELVEERDYDGAISLLDDAIAVVEDSGYEKKLKDRKREVEEERPKGMLDVVRAYQSGGNPYVEYSSKESGAESFSMGGVKYLDGMTFNADINIFDDVSWAVYNLGGKYRTLEFTACHVDGTDLGDDTVLQVFYDGELKEEIPLSPDMLPVDVSLDLTGVNQLKLQVPSSGSNGPLYGVGNPKIS